METLLLGDRDVCAVPAAAAVEAMREAVLAAHQGRLSAPPRVRAELAELDYVFTAGGLAAGLSGFRAYRVGEPAGDQLVAIWNEAGALVAVIVGDELGARRTGALGALSVQVLARPDAGEVAIVGSGPQAWTQLWALTAVRTVRSARVFSPNLEHRRRFAERARAELAVPAVAVDSPSEALARADIVILATRSRVPVIEAGEVEPGAHVVTVGPKFADAHETPVGLVERAALVSCDSARQAAGYGREFFTAEAPLVELGAIVAGAHRGRHGPADITLHCSVGLAGTEIVLAREVLTHAGALTPASPRGGTSAE